MFIYADETGNSGRNIFDENGYFRLGGLMTVSDIAPHVAAVLQPFLAERGKERLHAHEWPEEEIASLGHAVLDAIDVRGNWAFSLTEIHKPCPSSNELRLFWPWKSGVSGSVAG